ncbi:Gfo/Idh/MocA family oxidoreductase [candidate division WOR-3 bacterium]|nr:Gfo/Idh/MocA family oxidoreductase [candidate division WOR-3 bacterium]
MVNLAVLGVGYWGPNLLRNFSQIDGVTVTAVCDTDTSRLAYIHQKYPKLHLTNDYRGVLADSSIQAVAIALPAKLHYRIAMEALQAGKHVFVEKPLALSSEECLQLIHVAEEKDKVLMVGHTFEYNAAVNVLKEEIQKGTLGEIRYINSQRLNLGKIRQDVNVMWNLAPHDVSMILYVLQQEPLAVSAHGGCYIQEGIEDVVFMDLLFENGVRAHIHVSWLDPVKVRRMTVVGSEKMAVYDDMEEKKLKIYNVGIDMSSGKASYRKGEVAAPNIDSREPLNIECSHFVHCITDHQRPRTDGYDGLRVTRVLEAAQTSLRQNGKEVRLS